MCGIAGIVRSSASATPPLDARAFERLSADLSHRGPDDFGFLGWSPGQAPKVCRRPEVAEGAAVGLVHRRLSIIDLSEAGAQPMGGADGRFFLAYNGEIYNFVELRSELEALGHRFRGHSDTEVLLAGWAQWGSAVLPRLEGMFAFALLDARERMVTVARDPFGIKPLYYAAEGGRFAFASEIGALLRLVPGARRANAASVFEYLRFATTDHRPETMLEGVRHLPPGHYVELAVDGWSSVEPVAYWRLDPTARIDLSFDEAAAAVRDRFLANVDRHLRSDVPVGACLSGGIDSSACVAAMRHLRGDALELHTFSYVADDEELSEEKWIRLAGERSGATMHFAHPSPASLAADMDRLIGVQGEPMGSTSMYAQYRVFDVVARAGIKVVLDGQGADEIFGGYHGYVGARIASLARAGRYADAARLWRAARRRPGLEKVHALAAQFLVPAALQEPLRRLVRREVAPAWLNAAWFRGKGVALVREPAPDGGSADDVLRAELHRHLSGSMRSLLRFEDRNSMAFSIESRVPFLTPALAQFVLSLPEEHIVAPDGTTKAVFRAAMRGIVPDAILDRKDKIGFQTPEQRWLKELSPWVESILRSETARSIPALDHAHMMREWEAVSADPSRYRTWVWRWINLVRWVELNEVTF